MARQYQFDFKKLDVYQAAVEHFTWTLQVVERLSWPQRRLVDQMMGSSLSILGNLGEARGRAEKPIEMKQYYRYALGSTHESAAYLDALAALGQIDDHTYNTQELLLSRIGSMLTAMMRRQTSTHHPP